MKRLFSTGSIFKESYKIMKPKLWTLIQEYAILALTFIVLNSLGDKNFLISMLLSSLFSYFSIVFALAYVERGSFDFNNLFESITFKKFTVFFCAGLLVDLAVLGGFILLVIPAIIALIQLRFVKFILIEKEMKPMEALRESIRLTKGYRGVLFEFSLVSLLFNLLGAAAFGVGLFFTAPLTVIALTLIYKKLSARTDLGEEDSVLMVEAHEA